MLRDIITFCAYFDKSVDAVSLVRTEKLIYADIDFPAGKTTSLRVQKSLLRIISNYYMSHRDGRTHDRLYSRGNVFYIK